MLTQWRCIYSLPPLISLNCIKCLLTRKDSIPCRTDWSGSWLWESVERLSHSLAEIPPLPQKTGLRFKPHMKTSKEQRPDPLHQPPWLQDRRAAGFCPRAERSASLYQMNGLLLWPWEDWEGSDAEHLKLLWYFSNSFPVGRQCLFSAFEI